MIDTTIDTKIKKIINRYVIAINKSMILMTPIKKLAIFLNLGGILFFVILLSISLIVFKSNLCILLPPVICLTIYNMHFNQIITLNNLKK